jgi:hypothetical protein
MHFEKEKCEIIPVTHKTGKLVIAAQFHGAGKISDGLSLVNVQKNGRTTSGYIDKSGKFVWKTTD